MTKELTPESYWLTLTILMTSLFWLPYIVNRMKELGIWPALWSSEPDPAPQARWAFRMMHAHKNAVENLVLFAPLVLTLTMLGVSTPATAAACRIYFLSRAAHFAIYSMGLPLMRTIMFLIGFACQIVLAATILSATST